MPSILTYRVPDQLVLSILNTIYAIFLALLFTFFFTFRTDPTLGSLIEVKLMLTPSNMVFVGLLSGYFILDWLTANITISLQGGLNHLLLMTFILLIVYLGAVIIISFEPKAQLYLMFSIYASIVPLWDLIISRDPAVKARLWGKLMVYGVLLARLTVGLFMLSTVAMIFWLKPEQALEVLNNNFMLGLLALYVFFKFIRYLFYIAFDAKDLATQS